MNIEPLTPQLGAIVHGLDLGGAASDQLMRQLIDLLHAHGVLVITGQQLDESAYLRFARQWGRPLQFFIASHRDTRFPEIIHIDNDPATPAAMRDGAVHWHSDSSYEEEPAAVTMLYGRESPDEGGVTHFAGTAIAYDALSEGMKDRIDDFVAVHELSKAPWIKGETRPDPNRPAHNLPRVRHPLVMRHPVTGRKAIFTSGTACAIDGMEPQAARQLIRELREHVVRPDFRASYKIMPGDLLLWDNFGTVHCASPIDYSDAPGKRRLMWRISTKGRPALCEAPAADARQSGATAG